MTSVCVMLIYSKIHTEEVPGLITGNEIKYFAGVTVV